MEKISIVIFCLILSGALVAQKKKDVALTTPVAVSYSLPEVSFRVDVKLEHIRKIPGIYSSYAEKKLGIHPAVLKEQESWRILDMKVSPQYRPDKDAVYTIASDGEYDAITLSLSPEGLLMGLASRSDEPLGEQETRASLTYTLPKPFCASMDIGEMKTYSPLKEVLDSNYTYEEIDGVEKRIWDPIIRYEIKNEQENLDEVVKTIFQLRSERARLLLSDDERPDGKALEVLFKEYDQLEKEYMSLFTGKEERRVVECFFECTPEKQGEAIPVFRFSESEGIADKKNVSSVLYSLVIDNVVVPGAGNKASESAAVFFRIPATADVKLMRINEELSRFKAIIPQFGVLASFPVEVMLNERLSLSFYPEYGSLKRIVKY